jgi:hypothetical protein
MGPHAAHALSTIFVLPRGSVVALAWYCPDWLGSAKNKGAHGTETDRRRFLTDNASLLLNLIRHIILRACCVIGIGADMIWAKRFGSTDG